MFSDNCKVRYILAKSTLNNIPNYPMHYILLPKEILNSIDKIQRDFIWGSTAQKKKDPLP